MLFNIMSMLNLNIFEYYELIFYISASLLTFNYYK